jgi:copper chaperone CopZ
MRFRWHRLLQNPTTRVIAVDGGVARLRVDGMVCSGVCAVRTRQALASVEGVRSVHVDFDAGEATVEGTPRDAAVYERAVARAVLARPARKLIERAALRMCGARPRARGSEA